MSHQPKWVFEDGDWVDEAQPDSDQFGGTVGEWVDLLAECGVFPPDSEETR